MPSVVVLGAGVAGLATGVFLARAGHDVTLLERDGSAVPSEIEGAAAWSRATVPQSLHAHTFHALARRVLSDHAPDLLARMLAVGVDEYRLVDWLPSTAQREGAVGADRVDELVSLGCRRTTFEWFLRRAAEDQIRLLLLPGETADGLCWSRERARVTGVRTRDKRVINGDLVIDATGRRSPLSRWARRDCGVAFEIEGEACESVTYSKFFRIRNSVTAPALTLGNISAVVLDGLAGYAFRTDGDTGAVVLARLPRDTALARLREDAAFEAVAAGIPALAPWVDRDIAEPLSEVAVMSGLSNTMRQTVRGGCSTLPGLVSIGDALSTTNPAFGRGAALALAQADLLVDLMADPSEAYVRAPALIEQALASLTLPWWRDAIRHDRVRARMWASTVGVPHSPLPVVPTAVPLRRAAAAAMVDADIWVRLQRVLNMLDAPQTLFDDHDTAARVAALELQDRPPTPARARALDALAAV